MDYVRWQDRPQLRRPVLIAAFEGWNDAADAASTAVRYLRDRWSARPFATIDHEDFYDFTATRPQVRLVNGLTRRIEWPETELSWATLPGPPVTWSCSSATSPSSSGGRSPSRSSPWPPT